MARKTIRASQLVSPFGPGAVIDLGSESFSCVDIAHWPRGDCPVIADNPLRAILGVDVRSPPTSDRAGEVPVCRFPRWVFCPSCRRLYFLAQALERGGGDSEPTCPGASCHQATLTPMRFVAACDQGHLQDVDWFRWAHRNQQVRSSGQCSRQTAELSFRTTGASGGDFNAMSIGCRCGASSTLEGLTQGPYAFGCAGRQPWQDSLASTRCSAVARVFPRAASNIYYPQTRSAIDLEVAEDPGGRPSDQELRSWISSNPTISTLRGMASFFPDGVVPQAQYQGVAQEIARVFGISEDDAVEAIRSALQDCGGEATAGTVPSGGGRDSQHDILRREWPRLAKASPTHARWFRANVSDLKAWPASTRELIEQVTLIERLREVRALIGFRRVRPDSASALVPVDLGGGADWFPGVEAFGEGIFLKFREAAMGHWESEVRSTLDNRCRDLEAACSRWGRDPAGVYSSPRFLALHTFAHGFIRRLAFDAGYSSASIRERIYCDLPPAPAAGILLYTSDGDSEGSLGGLVRQGEPLRLLGTIQRTIADLAWCSADPVCSELEGQGVDGMNAAACHACCLVAETSCAHNNSLLDRRAVVGSSSMPGLLSALLPR